VIAYPLTAAADAEAVTVVVDSKLNVVLVLTDTVAVWPPLTLVRIFMSYPPYGVGTFLGLVTGLRPLGSRVAIGVVF
jgi:hypothetical protein